MSKECGACLMLLPITAFHVDKAAPTGVCARCKTCFKEKRPVTKRYPREVSPVPIAIRKAQARKKYEKTKTGFIMRAYRNALSRVRGIQKKGLHLYLGLEIMPKEEFYAWAKADLVFNRLFEAWKNSGEAPRLSPSVDRIDTTQGYIKGNVRWLTHSQNSQLGSLSRSASQTSTSISKRSA